MREKGVYDLVARQTGVEGWKGINNGARGNKGEAEDWTFVAF